MANQTERHVLAERASIEWISLKHSLIVTNSDSSRMAFGENFSPPMESKWTAIFSKKNTPNTFIRIIIYKLRPDAMLIWPISEHARTYSDHRLVSAVTGSTVSNGVSQNESMSRSSSQTPCRPSSRSPSHPVDHRIDHRVDYKRNHRKIIERGWETSVASGRLWR